MSESPVTVDRKRRQFIEEIFSEYDFGKREVVDSDGWDFDGQRSYTKIVYVEGETPEADSECVILTVVFFPDSSEPADIYALDRKTGEAVGQHPSMKRGPKP